MTWDVCTVGRLYSGTFSSVGRLVPWDVQCCGTFSDVGRLVMGRFELWDV